MRAPYAVNDVYPLIVYNQRVMDSPQSSPDSVPANHGSRRRLTTILKIGVTAVGLLLVVWNLNFSSIISLISGIHWGWMMVGAVLIGLSLIIRAYRWHIILHEVGSSIRFGRLVELYLVGSFFNAFLPSGLGGDVVRAAEAAQDVDTGVAVSTVLVDRLSGLMALFVMALVVLPFRPSNFPNSLAVTIAVISLAGLIMGVILVDGRLFAVMIQKLPENIRSLGDGFMGRFSQSIQNCGWQALGKALVISVGFNLIQVGWWASAGRALSLEIPFSYYLLVVPLMSLALLVPSIGGLGVRENLAPMLFVGAGVSAEQSVALTLLVFGLERVASLLGAPVYIHATLRDKQNRGLREPLVPPDQ